MDNGASSYRRFLEGDDNGLTEIVRDYKDGLILYLNGFVGNIYAAEDLIEETFLKLIIKKPKFKEESSFKTWLYAVGRNIAIDYLRRNSKRLDLSMDDVQTYLSDEQDVENSYITGERNRVIYEVLKNLNPDYRQILWLAYFEDFSNSEISTVMRKNKRQVKNLLYRAKNALKNELNKEDFIHEEL